MAGLRAIHDRGIILRDLTRNNVMFTDDDQVRFIDLEFAYELDRKDAPVPAFTAGYASPEQLRNETPSTTDDCYALGALILDMTCFTASGYPLNRAGVLSGLELALRDLRLPAGLLDLVDGLTAPDAGKRWTLDDAEAALDRLPTPTALEPVFHPEPKWPGPSLELTMELRDTLEGILTSLEESADFGRTDRLWPASAELFSTNPINLQCGASGPAFLLLRARGQVAPQIIEWIERGLKTRPTPPSLYSGYGGVALLFLATGAELKARQVLKLALDDRELRFQSPGLFYGAAGWGLAHLHFWHVTGEQSFLRQALEAAEHLLVAARHSSEGSYWDTHGLTLLGYGEGQSGIALFLLFLYQVHPDQRFLETAVRAIDYDLSKRQEGGTGGKLLWYPRADAAPHHPKSPHMWFGTVGVGTAVLRCYAVTQEVRYLDFARWCARSAAHRYTNKIWQDYGLAGFGEYLLDMYQILGDEEYLNNAYYHAEGLLPYRVREGRGIAFPGRNLARICSDFGMGTAGIGLFIHRLLNPQTPRLLMLDELFTSRRSGAHSVDSGLGPSLVLAKEGALGRV